MNEYLRSFIQSTYREPASALDLGAGDNADVNALRAGGWKCAGVDVKTGTNLEELYLSGEAPFDLIFSNYVIHKLKNKAQLLKTAYANLKSGGWFFLHTFDKGDTVSSSDLTCQLLQTMLADAGFTHISTRIIHHHDTDPGHDHWHEIIETLAKKK